MEEMGEGAERMPNEDYAIVLDYLPQGKSSGYKSEPLAQVMGTAFFTLLEVIPKSALAMQEQVYVGREEREKITQIKCRIMYRDLTSTAVAELERAVEVVVEGNTQRFLDFFNKSTAITIKRHQLELLPGLGKKHMIMVLEERHKKPFESFDEISQRIPAFSNPKSAVVKRIIEEIRGEADKHYLFARPPAPPREHFGFHKRR